MQRDEIEAILKRELPWRIPGLVAAYLFGSTARGDARADSDVDLGLLYSRAPAATLADQPFAVAADLASLLGREVDAVVLNGAPVDLIHRVLREGSCIFETDRSARIAFEVRSRNEYFDLLPILRRYRGQTEAR
jgi:predicted nucleotidyltransferase